VAELDQPLGVAGEEGGRGKLQAIIMSIDVPVHSGKVRRPRSAVVSFSPSDGHLLVLYTHLQAR
jgi:hypothetical protein